MAMGSLPFQYFARWGEIHDLSAPMLQLLEERDRELEDFLAGLGGGQASALRRITNQIIPPITDPVTVDMDVTDYLEGCEESTFAGGACLQVVASGVWHCTTFTPAYSENGACYCMLRIMRGSSPVQQVFALIPLSSGAENALVNISMDALCEAGDKIVVQIAAINDFETPNAIVFSSSDLNAAFLSAHLVG